MLLLILDFGAFLCKATCAILASNQRRTNWNLTLTLKTHYILYIIDQIKNLRVSLLIGHAP